MFILQLANIALCAIIRTEIGQKFHFHLDFLVIAQKLSKISQNGSHHRKAEKICHKTSAKLSQCRSRSALLTKQSDRNRILGGQNWPQNPQLLVQL